MPKIRKYDYLGAISKFLGFIELIDDQEVHLYGDYTK